jgi:hypothetical protein
MTWRVALVVALVSGGCTSPSTGAIDETSPPASQLAESTEERSLPCADETGQVGTLLVKMVVDGKTIEASYGAGTRAPCPDLIEKGASTPLVALDGFFHDIDEHVVMVKPNVELRVSVLEWSNQIHHRLAWSSEDLKSEPTAETLDTPELGTWIVMSPDEPGTYLLTLRLTWHLGQDEWGWKVIVDG